jgi:hypothetical protein
MTTTLSAYVIKPAGVTASSAPVNNREASKTQVRRAALAEVRFTGIIPEPTTATMLALSSLFVFRRRR